MMVEQTDLRLEGFLLTTPNGLKARNLLHQCNMIQATNVGYVTETTGQFLTFPKTCPIHGCWNNPGRRENSPSSHLAFRNGTMFLICSFSRLRSWNANRVEPRPRGDRQRDAHPLQSEGA